MPLQEGVTAGVPRFEVLLNSLRLSSKLLINSSLPSASLHMTSPGKVLDETAQCQCRLYRDLWQCQHAWSGCDQAVLGHRLC